MPWYKVLVILITGQKKYLGSYPLPGNDPWAEIDQVAKAWLKPEEYKSMSSVAGYRNDMPGYSSIIDAETFCSIAAPTA
jgi:hypothetical protein